MAGLRGRRPAEVDWQQELAAQQQDAGTVVAAEPPERAARRRRALELWRTYKGPVNAICVPIASAALIDFRFHHGNALAQAILWAAVVGSVAWGVQTLTRRHSKLRALEHEQRGVPLLEILNGLWRTEENFLEDLPDLEEYQQWLTSATDEIKRYSPALAGEWAVPGAALSAQPDHITADVITERIERTKALHRKVVTEGVSLTELAAARSLSGEAALAARAGNRA
jgi:hypothetical protein